MAKFVKAMYVMWPDTDYIDKAIETGVNTFFVNLYDHTPNEEITEIFKKYKGKVELIPTEANIKLGKPLPMEHQFFDGQKHYECTPCPTSQLAVDELFKFPFELYNQGLCSAMSVDFEDYGWTVYTDKVIPYNLKWDEGMYKCKCDRCKDMTEHEQRQKNSDMIKAKTGNIRFYVFPQVNPYLWKISDWWLNEFTYEKLGDWSRILKNTYRMKKDYNVTLDNLSGLWLEKFTAKNYLYYLKNLIKSPATDGYWIYTQMRMSKNCWWRTHPGDPYSVSSLASIPYHSYIDDPNDPTADPEFFTKLKRLNDDIDDLRSGWGFAIMKMIYKFFR